MPEGRQFQYATRCEGSFSIRAPDTGADKTSIRKELESPSEGSSSNKSVQVQEMGPEQDARHNAQKELEPKTESRKQRMDRAQKMETEEGAMEVQVVAQARTGP